MNWVFSLESFLLYGILLLLNVRLINYIQGKTSYSNPPIHPCEYSYYLHSLVPHKRIAHYKVLEENQKDLLLHNSCFVALYSQNFTH